MRILKIFVKNILLSLILVSCAPGQLLGPSYTETPPPTLTPTFTLTPSATPTPIPTSTKTNTPIPTDTPTSTPTPTPIAGIEEPIEVLGSDFLMKSATIEDEIPTQSGPKLPRPGNHYVAIAFYWKIMDQNSQRELTLVCEGKEYRPEDFYLFFFGEEGNINYIFYFEVPEEIDPIICALRINDQSVNLAPLFQP
jgi:hypothetical protein